MAPKTKEEDQRIDTDDGLVYPESWGTGNQESWKPPKRSWFHERTEATRKMEEQMQWFEDY